MTALEIFGNPKDLSFTLRELKNDGPWGMLISRGPGHNFKPLLSGDSIPNKLNAMEVVKEVLETVIKLGLAELPKFGGDRELCLTEDQASKILEDLEKTGQCETYR